MRLGVADDGVGEGDNCNANIPVTPDVKREWESCVDGCVGGCVSVW